MDRIHWLLAAFTTLAFAVAGWLYLENQDLRSQLVSSAAAVPASSATDTAPAENPTTTRESAGKGTSLLSRLGKSVSREAPSLSEPQELSREEKRVQRMEFIRNLLGRGVDESEDDYKARLVPLIESGLEAPRTRLEDARAKAEKAADVSREQREKLDQILDDASKEAISAANAAIASGDLSPYRRNWAGTLQVAGGMGAILTDADTRMSEVLSAEQRQTIYDSGFEWGEYIGAHTPWETLMPPAPAPK